MSMVATEIDIGCRSRLARCFRLRDKDLVHLLDSAWVLDPHRDVDGLAVCGRLHVHHLAADDVDEPFRHTSRNMTFSPGS